MRRVTARIQRLAAQTPAHRERYVDFLRAVAILAVVTGHWLVITVEYDPQGRLTGSNVLGALTWSHPLTWLFQVMPVFFVVGGYANAASLAAHRRGRGDHAGWLLDRSARLVRPTTLLLMVAAAGAALAHAVGAPAGQIGTAAWLVSIPLWFLVVYLGMIALTPVTYALHRWAGPWVPPLLLLPVAAADALRFATGAETPGYPSFVFGWLAIHQVGFSWRDGRLPQRPRTAALVAAGGVVALVLLTVVGPYPVSMVSVPGADMQNSSPPTLALVALAATQLGLVLTLRQPIARWLRRPRPWQVVIGVNSVILTMFLWHMAAVVVLAALLHRLGRLPTPPVDTARWLLWQPAWLTLLAIVLVLLVAAAGRVETRAAVAGGPWYGIPGAWARRARAASGRLPSPLLVATTAGYAATLTGLMLVTMAGDADHGPFGLPTAALATFFAGAAVLHAARAVRRTAQAHDAG